MKPTRPVHIVGAGHSVFLGRGHPDFIHKPTAGQANPDLETHLKHALQACFDNAGVDAGLVDKAYLSNFLGERFVNQAHMGALLPRVEPKLDGIPIARLEAACASGGASIAAAADAIQAGADVVLVAGVEVETNVPGREGVEHMALAAHMGQQQHLDRFLFPHLFARRAKAYKENTDATEEDLARVVAKAYNNAHHNPWAQMQAVPMTVDKANKVDEHNYLFLDDQDLHSHIKLLDCTTFTDGASAVLLASPDGLRTLGLAAEATTQMLSYGHSVAALGAETDPRFMSNMHRAAKVAYQDASRSPSDIDVAEVHDCFSITELQVYEALELAERGQGFSLIREGRTQRDGDIPVNTGGGLLGFGHPIGATGVKQVAEVFRQLTGQCGDYQLSSSPQVGISANLGGDDRTAVVIVQQRAG